MPAKKSSKLSLRKASTTTFKRAILQSGTSETVQVSRPWKRLLIVAAVLLLLGALLYYFKGLFIVSIVNGEPISRLKLIQQLEKQNGQQTLKMIVTQTLIEQEAKKQKIAVAQNEINEKIEKIEDDLKKQNRKLEDALSFQGMTRNDLAEQLRFQSLIEKMIGKNINVTDKEINDYIEKNRESYPQDAKIGDLKKEVEQQLRQQKLSEKYQSWLDGLQKNAKIVNFVNF